jgi:ribosomal-protein-alanine N-acetyltransferase
MIEAVGGEEAGLLAGLHARAFDRPWSVDELRKLMENPAVFAFVARGDAPLGFVMAWSAAGDSELLTLAVVPEARRGGVGAELVAVAGAAARARGAASMHLEVAEENLPARALYASLGFEEVGRRPGYYPGAVGAIDAIVMRRALPEGAG